MSQPTPSSSLPSPPSIKEKSADKTKILQQVASDTTISLQSISNTISLLETGNTVPFIARYRKEVTGNLDETRIRDLYKLFSQYIALEERKIDVVRLIEKQGKLTPELEQQIIAASTLQTVDDLYLPFKPKLKTLGAKARDKGLEPLANLIKQIILESQTPPVLETVTADFIQKDKGVESVKDALSGAIDILAEDFGTQPEARGHARDILFHRNIIKAEVHEDVINGTQQIKTEEGKPIDPHTFDLYFNFSLEGSQLLPHQILALARAEDLNVLSLNISTPEEDILRDLKKIGFRSLLTSSDASAPQTSGKAKIESAASTSWCHDAYHKAIEAGFKRYILGSLKRELWNQMKSQAETHAIKVFATNLKHLLMTPPVKERSIIGIDPGFRTGCKVAVIDTQGNYLDTVTIYPHEPQRQTEAAQQILLTLAKKYHAYTFSIGNGTASRETEQFIASFIRLYHSKNLPFEYIIVSEAGASIYSASEIAIEEFPNLDVTVRGAISIARRVQDPLAELIKIDPKSIGVGLYQHDVNQHALKEELNAVIEDCVNAVGVDLNTASPVLLERVSGLTKRLAKEIIAFRKDHGRYYNRLQLLEVKGMGEKTFEQSAGFLKIYGGTEPFDATFIHPESYELIRQILAEIHLGPADLVSPTLRTQNREKILTLQPNGLARKFAVDPAHIRSLLELLLKPDLDPRDELPPPILRQDILAIDDLKEGMIVRGTVSNVVDFGAFVDIGVKINGLVHKSQMASRFVKNPHEVLAVGDVKDFLILAIDRARQRIQLSLKLPSTDGSGENQS